MKSWYERFGFGKSTKGMFDGEAPGELDGVMSCNKKRHHLVNRQQ